MARWKLLNAHYLNVPDSTWEYKETDRTTGRQVVKRFDVPRLLDPRDPADWNHVIGRDDGEIIVSDGKGADPRDIIYKGKPTPDMLPLDEEATAISKAASKDWKQPVEGMTGDYSQSILSDLQKDLAIAQTNAGASASNEALTSIAAAMAKQTELLSKLVESRRL